MVIGLYPQSSYESSSMKDPQSRSLLCLTTHWLSTHMKITDMERSHVWIEIGIEHSDRCTALAETKLMS